jgi:hypothetical protein
MLHHAILPELQPLQSDRRTLLPVPQWVTYQSSEYAWYGTINLSGSILINRAKYLQQQQQKHMHHPTAW